MKVLQICAVTFLAVIVHQLTHDIADKWDSAVDLTDSFLLKISGSWNKATLPSSEYVDGVKRGCEYGSAWRWTDGVHVCCLLWEHEVRVLVTVGIMIAIDFSLVQIIEYSYGFKLSPLSIDFIRRLPPSPKIRLGLLFMGLLLSGFDVHIALEKFLAFSMQRPLASSTPHPQWQPTARTVPVNTSLRQHAPILVGPPAYVVPNFHLECELRHALRHPGVVIVSGSRAIGKSTVVREVIKGRGGLYCDVQTAASPEGLDKVIDGCTKPHRLLQSMWTPFANVITFLVINPVGHLFSGGPFDWLEALTNAFSLHTKDVGAHVKHNQARAEDGPRFLDDQAEGDTDTLPSCFVRDGSVSLPLVLVLDGMQDGSQSAPLGLLERSTAAMTLIRKTARTATVVIVAANDNALGIRSMQQSELTGIATRTTFIIASPSSESALRPLFDEIGTILKSPSETDTDAIVSGTKQDRAAKDIDPCNRAAECLPQWVGGAFELTTAWMSFSGANDRAMLGQPVAKNICAAANTMLLLRCESVAYDALALRSAVEAADTNFTTLGFDLRVLELALRIAVQKTVSKVSADRDAANHLIRAQIVGQITVNHADCALDGNSGGILVPQLNFTAPIYRTVIGRVTTKESATLKYRCQNYAAHASNVNPVASKSAKKLCDTIETHRKKLSAEMKKTHASPCSLFSDKTTPDLEGGDSMWFW